MLTSKWLTVLFTRQVWSQQNDKICTCVRATQTCERLHRFRPLITLHQQQHSTIERCFRRRDTECWYLRWSKMSFYYTDLCVYLVFVAIICRIASL